MQNEGFCSIIKLKGMIRLLKLLLAWRTNVNKLGQRGIDKNHTDAQLGTSKPFPLNRAQTC